MRRDALAENADRVRELIDQRTIAVLTGAGCSTESGIPDYRGPSSRLRVRRPIQHREFVERVDARQRYWARSTIGWPRLASARPNAAHRALAGMEEAGRLAGLVTQNVDRLHTVAGSRHVVELHGALAEVICLGCAALESRDRLQDRLLALNPTFRHRAAELAPDGDAELPDDLVATFRVPGCTGCGGVLKPHVVFFGGSVPRPVVDAASQIVSVAEVLLVVGSSLTVFSGYRFVRRAAERTIPIVIINLGTSRADPLATLTVHAQAGEILPLIS